MNRDDIIQKVFPHSLFGYDPVAVDAFLDEVIREFDRMENTIDVLKFRLAQEIGEQRMNETLPPEIAPAGLIEGAGRGEKKDSPDEKKAQKTENETQQPKE